jgi:hypothetical protein
METFLVAIWLVVSSLPAAADMQRHTMVPLESLVWRGGANGVSTAIAEGDPSKAGPFTMMLKLADGAWLQPHWHNVDKRLYLIKGELLMGTGDVVDPSAARPLGVGGTAVVPANTRHFEGGKGETIVALSATGPFTTTSVQAKAPAPAASAGAPSPQTPGQKPPVCDQPEHRQFDFWVGEWEVVVNGKPAGINAITKEMKDCVIHEHWRGSGGLRGESFNVWDRTRRKWHQTWVTDTGGLLVLEGEFVDGAMRMSGETMSPKGPVMNRVTWTPHPDGGLRQFWETSNDGGKTWQTAFDGVYRRLKNSHAGGGRPPGSDPARLGRRRPRAATAGDPESRPRQPLT